MKKILLVADQPSQLEDFRAPKIQAMMSNLEQYDAKVMTVMDNGLDCDGDTRISAKDKIEKQGPEWVRNDPEFLAELKDANIIMIHYSAIGRMALDAAPNLEMIAIMRSGCENINVPLCTERGIIVSNAPGRSSEEVADMAVTLMLTLNRYITHNDLVGKKGFDYDYPMKPQLVRDLTVGLVGFGDIARRVCKKLSGFGCPIIAYDPYANPELAKQMGVELVPLDELMKHSDVISVHARLTKDNDNLIGKKEIALMKDTALFVNTARAGLVDEEALTEALTAKRIRGAALDVFKKEPLDDGSVLRTFDNVILTPHIAGRIDDGFKISVEIVAAEVERYLKGVNLLNKVN